MAELGNTLAEGDSVATSPLGDAPALDTFERRREQMRARLLAVSQLDRAATWAPGERRDEPTPPTIGRYAIHRLLGRGGMGIVYVGHDAALDRDLAIKLIRDDGPAASVEHRARLQREARAMARLSHPNVVTVHEVGEHEGQLFIAMEYIAGASLARWLERESPGWRATLAKLLSAGEGLAAVHAAGIIHRDFKPDNVLIGADGRVRVADFGLAWTSDRLAASPDVDGEVDGGDERDGPSLRTKTGALLGTPAYMAPEQYRGEPVSFAADQFSFCVSLYVALYGQLPFDDSSPAGYREALLSGALRPAPKRARVPRWIFEIVARGLEPDPEARWPSIEALLTTLRRRAARRRWPLATALALSSLALALGAATLRARAGSDPACEPAAAQLEPIWGPRARQQLERRFLLATAAVDVERVWRTVSASLDRYVSRWTHEYERRCAARDHAAPSARAPEALACLDDARAQLAAVTALLAEPSPAIVESAAVAVTGLPAPERCGEALGGELPPRTADARARATALRRTLALASVDIEFGRLGRARDALTRLLESARALEDPSLEAEVLLTLGRALRDDGALAEARERLESARALVRDAPRPSALELRALVQLVDLVGAQQRELERAEALAAEAAELARALGRPPLLEAYLANNLARARRVHKRYDAATDGYLTAYTLLKQTLGDDAAETIAVRSNLGVVLSLRGEPEAIELLEQVSARQLEVHGEAHPRTPAILRSLGNALGRRREYARAESVLRRAARLREANFGAAAPRLPYDLLSLARVLRGLGRLDEAARVLTRATDLHTKTSSSADPSFARERSALDEAAARQALAPASATRAGV